MTLVKPIGLISSLVAYMAICSSAIAATGHKEISDPAINGHFELIREPSGVIALSQDSLIVIEDEARHALRRLSLTGKHPDAIAFEEFDQPTGQGFIQRQRLAPLDDLEGIARLSSSQFLVIGSHENASRGTWPAREKLVLFTREGNDIVSAMMRRDLLAQLEKHYPELTTAIRARRKRDRQALNIEAIAFDRKRQQLHIGLRTPLLSDNAIIVRLDNVAGYLAGEEPKFADKLQRLQLDKGGIRALTYDDSTDQFLIISKRESGGKKRTRLWSLPANSLEQPTRYKSDNKNLFENVEGLTPFAGGILFVRDNGGQNIPGRDDWFVLARSQLGLGE